MLISAETYTLSFTQVTVTVRRLRPLQEAVAVLTRQQQYLNIMMSEVSSNYRVAIKLDDGCRVEATYLSHHTCICTSVITFLGFSVILVADHN